MTTFFCCFLILLLLGFFVCLFFLANWQILDSPKNPESSRVLFSQLSGFLFPLITLFTYYLPCWVFRNLFRLFAVVGMVAEWKNNKSHFVGFNDFAFFEFWILRFLHMYICMYEQPWNLSSLISVCYANQGGIVDIRLSSANWVWWGGVYTWHCVEELWCF